MRNSYISKMKWVLACLSILVLTSVCRSEFCDEGPPGKYCLEDLSGYHDCRKDAKTGKMVDEVYKCTKNTRCKCFFGPPCPEAEEDPCHVYRTPPVFPKQFSVLGNMNLTECNQTACITATRKEVAFLDQVDKTNQKYRLDRKVLKYKLSEIWLQNKDSHKFDQFTIRWDIKSCDNTAWPFIPNLNIDRRFSYYGKEKIGDKMTEKWIWIEGGHNSKENIHTTIWNLWQNTTASDRHYEPVKMRRFDEYPVKKSNFTVTERFTFSSEVDERMFDLPDYCEKPSVNFDN